MVLATGKAFPYPVALAHFLGRAETVIAENGGVVHVDGETAILGDAEAPRAVVEAFRERGGDPGWGARDTVNRWRETEVALSLDADEALLREVAAAAGGDVEVVDTGYAYHVKSTGVSKGRGLERVGDALVSVPTNSSRSVTAKTTCPPSRSPASRTRSPTPTAPLARLPISW